MRKKNEKDEGKPGSARTTVGSNVHRSASEEEAREVERLRQEIRELQQIIGELALKAWRRGWWL